MQRIWVIVAATVVAMGLAACTAMLRDDPHARGLAPGDGVLRLPESALAGLTPRRGETATMPNRLEERYRFPAGFVEYESLSGRAFYPEEVEGPSYRALFLGVSVNGRAVPAHLLEPRRSGTVSYAPVLVAGQPCLTFRRALGPVAERGRRSLVAGVLCRPGNDPITEDAFLTQALAYAEGLEAR